MPSWFKSTSSQHVEFGGRVGIRKGSEEIAALACAGRVKATISLNMILGGRFGYFEFFFCFRGGGREEESEAKRGGYFYLEIERGGGVRGGEAGRCTPALGGVSRGGGG